jgi:SAM-dependent methyltransferase
MSTQPSLHGPLTDRMLSHAATEYVWDVDGNIESHDMLIPPVLRLLKDRAPKRVLDLGCGNGAFTALLARQGFEVDGCDGSTSGIEIARREYPQLSFWHQDLAQPLARELAGRYDAVVSTEVIEHLPLPRKLMSSAIHALKPGGLFIVTTPYHGYWKNVALALTGKFDDHWHPLRDFGHIKFFSKATLTMLFQEFRFANLAYTTAGRIPLFAKSMILSGTAPL